MKSNRIIIGIIAAVIVVGGAVALGSSNHKSTSVANPVAASTDTNMVNIKNYMFMPGSITVKVGTMVTWTNQDNVGHTITADTVSSNAPSSMDIGNGQSYSFKFTVPGTYAYHCFPHPYMHGSVIVSN
jgi:plastocyanin